MQGTSPSVRMWSRCDVWLDVNGFGCSRTLFFCWQLRETTLLPFCGVRTLEGWPPCQRYNQEPLVVKDPKRTIPVRHSGRPPFRGPGQKVAGMGVWTRYIPKYTLKHSISGITKSGMADPRNGGGAVDLVMHHFCICWGGATGALLGRRSLWCADTWNVRLCLYSHNLGFFEHFFHALFVLELLLLCLLYSVFMVLCLLFYFSYCCPVRAPGL